MNEPIQDLIEEHGGIMVMLSIMGEVAAKLRKGEAVEKVHLEKIVEFLKNFADKCHHGKEEDILFPELLKNPANVTAVNELLGEHKTGRDYIRGIAESLENYQAGNPDAIHIAVNIDGYIALLTQHIHKENEQLFQLADEQFTPELSQSMKAQFDRIETEVIGAGKHEEYHRWLEELRSIYPAG